MNVINVGLSMLICYCCRYSNQEPHCNNNNVRQLFTLSRTKGKKYTQETRTDIEIEEKIYKKKITKKQQMKYNKNNNTTKQTV